MTIDPARAPLRPVRLGSREMDVERREGNIYLGLLSITTFSLDLLAVGKKPTKKYS